MYCVHKIADATVIFWHLASYMLLRGLHLHIGIPMLSNKLYRPRRELPGNYPGFTMVMVIYHYVDRI